MAVAHAGHIISRRVVAKAQGKAAHPDGLLVATFVCAGLLPAKVPRHGQAAQDC